MTKQLRSTKNADGSGEAVILSGVNVAARIQWRGENGATPLDVIALTLQRMQDEQRGGPFGSPECAKAIAHLELAKRELSGQVSEIDGVPVIGD